MTALHTVGLVFIVFALVKLWIVRRALRERAAYLAGASAHDPSATFARPALFAWWVGWRVAAALLALGAGLWLVLR
ncbi:MAG: hypothetical protein N3B15_03760 [Planctomycetota bacterium]|nr:hypothetical protein [Planctomycetota bacterium]MCX8039673.1 hypothetical protein [Planctomycetota bacterium]